MTINDIDYWCSEHRERFVLSAGPYSWILKCPCAKCRSRISLEEKEKLGEAVLENILNDYERFKIDNFTFEIDVREENYVRLLTSRKRNYTKGVKRR